MATTKLISCEHMSMEALELQAFEVEFSVLS